MLSPQAACRSRSGGARGAAACGKIDRAGGARGDYLHWPAYPGHDPWWVERGGTNDRARPTRMRRSSPQSILMRSTPDGCSSAGSSSSECRSDSRCWKPDSAGRVKRSTCLSSACSTRAYAGCCTGELVLRSCSAPATRLSAGTIRMTRPRASSSCGMSPSLQFTAQPAFRCSRMICFSSRSPTALDDLLGSDGWPDAVHRRRHLLRRRLRVHLPHLRPLVLGTGRLPRDHGL